PVTIDGGRSWVTFEDLEGDDSDFDQIGVAFAGSGAEQQGRVGNGEGRLMGMRDLVDFAASWMTANRV
ncbi:MAG: AAC(3) family N-acetyltransferase, partial [Acidimicrobiia bacterium]|nr:AAC(3) family N-acetyltransferase [Acidimicrobiia bacterium]